MITENLSTLKIHKLTQAQYDRELAAGNLDPQALYLTPDEASATSYTASITTTWTGSAAPYTQDIAVTGITANDNPVVDLTMSGTYATDQARLADWGKIYRIVTAANKITIYATAKTTASLPIQLQVVR